MARRGAVTSENLVALGADRLATLVLAEAARNAAFKKACVAALAGAQGPAAVAAVADRRLAALERARGLVAWEKRKAFAADLQGLLDIVVNDLGPHDPGAGADRLLRFLTCAGNVVARVEDGTTGTVQDIFDEAIAAFVDLAGKVPEDARLALARRLVAGLGADRNDIVDDALRRTIPLLNPAALADIDARLVEAVSACGNPKSEDWQRLARRDRLVRLRQAIADARGDVDAYIALHGERRGSWLDEPLAVAERLRAAGRLAEALDWVRRPARSRVRVITEADLADGASGLLHGDRVRLRLEIRILIELGRKAEAQDLRWQAFQKDLDAEMLRDFVAALDDFEEFDVLDRAFAHAAAHADHHRALVFFLAWPRPDLAAKLVLDRKGRWEGRSYTLLRPAAETLAHDHPVAATVVYRALIDDVLATGRSAAYGHAARYLAALGELATADLGAAGLEDDAAYREGLRRAHGRKTGFWSLAGGGAAPSEPSWGRRTLR